MMHPDYIKAFKYGALIGTVLGIVACVCFGILRLHEK